MRLLRNRFTIGFSLIAMAASAHAQQPGGASILARFHVVDRDQIEQWEGLMEERMQELRATGQGFRHVFEQVRGNLETYLIITPYDGPNFAASENWLNALNDVVSSSVLQTQQAYPDAFTLELGEDVSVPGQYMYVRERVVAPDRSDDYYVWQRDVLIPALRRAEVGDVRTLRITHGGNIHTWIRYSYIDQIPALGDPDRLADSMSERQLQQMMAAGDAMTLSASDYIYQYRADLSYDSNSSSDSSSESDSSSDSNSDPNSNSD